MIHKIIIDGTNTFPAFEINPTKEQDWQNLIKKKGFFHLQFIPGLWWFSKHFWFLFIFLGGVLINACLTTLAQDYIKQPIQDVRLDKSQFEQAIQTLTSKRLEKP